MKRSEVNDLGAVMQSYDDRTWGETDVIAWGGVVGDLTFVECQRAIVQHYSTSTDRIMPAHVRRIALAARQDAAMRELPSGGGELKPMPAWFRERFAAEMAALRDRRVT